ncbi:unnamed protein product [Boreogadus saida]
MIQAFQRSLRLTGQRFKGEPVHLEPQQLYFLALITHSLTILSSVPLSLSLPLSSCLPRCCSCDVAPLAPAVTDFLSLLCATVYGFALGSKAWERGHGRTGG